MPRYRKRPVVIHASQWYTDGDHSAVQTRMVSGSPVYVIPTLEGDMRVSPGDWIITGVHGEHYACKPDIFALTYERIPDDDNA